VLQAAADAVHTTLRSHPQLDVLVVGFGHQVKAAVADLLFYIRYGQRRLAFTFQHHALGGDVHRPGRLVAVGAQDHAFEIGVVAGRGRPFDTVELLQLHFALSAGGDARKLTAQVGKQRTLLAGQGGGFLQDAGAAGVLDHVVTLVVARLEQQFVAYGCELALHAGQPNRRRLGRLALEDLTRG